MVFTEFLQFAAVFRHQLVQDILRHFQSGTGTEEYRCSEFSQSEDERVGGAAVFKVAPERNRHPPDIASFFFQGVEVAQCLCGMLVAAVAGINHRDGGIIGHQFGGAFPRVAEDDNIGITADNPGHIGDTFAFREMRSISGRRH